MTGLRLAFTFICIAIHFFSFGQCGIIPLSVEQKTKSAAHIARAKIIDATTYVGDRGYVYTLYTAQVQAWAKGQSRATNIAIEMIGGVHGNRATTVSGTISLTVGNDYLLFLTAADKSRLRRSPLAKHYLASQSQGAVRLTGNLFTDAATGEKLSEEQMFSRIASITGTAARTPAGAVYKPTAAKTIQQPLGIQSVSSFVMGANISGSIQVGDRLRISGTGFGAAPGNVFFRSADNGGAIDYVGLSFGSDIITWADGFIEVKIPTEAGTGRFIVQTAGGANLFSATDITINYALMNIYSDFFNFPTPTRQRPHYLNSNGTGGYSFRYNTGFAANTVATAAFERALNNWRCATGVNFSVSPATTTASVNANDGINSISFLPGSHPLLDSALGKAFISYVAQANSGCQQQNTVWAVADLDILFADVPLAESIPTASWQFGPAAPSGTQWDFESVALHELGHSHGLGHVILPGAVMHWALTNGATNRTLSTHDIAAGENVLAFSAAPCLIPAGYSGTMIDATCTLPVSFAHFEGRKKNLENVLSWSTADEKENRGFYIERSVASNGGHFESIGFVSGKNTTAASYQFTDAAPGRRTWLYRLKQVDYNGRIRYSNTVQIEGEGASGFAIWASGREVQVQASAPGTLQLLAPDGRLLTEKRLTPGQSSIILPQNMQGVVHYRFNNTYNGKLFIQ